MTSLLRYFGMPEVASAHGKGIDELILYVHLLMGALFVGWLAYFIFVMFRFKKSSNPKADYVGVRSHASTYLEIGVAIDYVPLSARLDMEPVFGPFNPWPIP